MEEGKGREKSYSRASEVTFEMEKNIISNIPRRAVQRFSATAVLVVCPYFQNEVIFGKGPVLAIQVRKKDIQFYVLPT